MTTYECSKCGYTSNSRGNANLHVQNVSKCKGAEVIDKIVKEKCEICNKEFDTEKLLMNHKKRCVKKTVTNVEYISPNHMEEYMIKTTKVMNMVVEENKQLRDTLNLLMKRLEKLEGSGKEEVEEEESDEPCQYFKLIKFIPTSRDQVKGVLRENDIEDLKHIVVTANGQRSLELTGTVTKEGIEVGDVVYYYNPAKKEKSSSDLKVIIKKYCLNSAKAGHEYCKEHCQ